MDAFISFLVIAFFCFAAVLWLKRGESKYRLDKTKLVDGFIKKNNIDVAKFYSGNYCDLVLDTTNRSIWFFVLEQLTLKYKQIPFDDLFYVALKYDGNPIDVYRRQGQLRREMLGGEGLNKLDLGTIQNAAEFKIIKNVSITMIMDDRHASTVDALFLSHVTFANPKTIKDEEAKTWFALLANIIQDSEAELRQSE